MKRNSKLYFALLLAIIAAVLSISVFASGNGDLIVYITQTGGRYHSDGCGSLSRSKYEITLEEAIIEGYTPCDRCNPPIYTGDAVPYETREVHSGGSGSWSSSNETRHIESSSEKANISHRAYEYSEQQQSWHSQNEKASVGTIIGYVIGVLLFGPVVLMYAYSLILYPLWRLAVYLYNLLPWVKKKKEKQRQEEQRLRAEAEARERLAAQKELEAKCSAREDLFINSLAAFSSKMIETSFPFEQLIQDRKAALKKLLLQNDACIRNGLVCDEEGDRFGDRCTVYYLWDASCYHLKKCRYSGSRYAHILHPPKNMRPCSVCRPDLAVSEWMVECEQLNNELAILTDCERIICYPNKKKVAMLAIKASKIANSQSRV